MAPIPVLIRAVTVLGCLWLCSNVPRKRAVTIAAPHGVPAVLAPAVPGCR